MRKLGLLIKYQDAIDLAAGDEEKLFILAGSQLAETFVQKKGADHIAPA